MNNEIKEILDMLKDSNYIPSDDNRTYKLLDKDDTRHLLDYITNLQSEVKSGNNIILAHKNRIKEFKKEIINLQEELKNAKSKMGK